MLLIIIGGIMMLLGGITSIATAIGGADIFVMPDPEMSANILKMLTIPLQWLFYTITSTIQKNQVGLLWYGLLLVICGLVLIFKGGRRTKSALASTVSLFFHGFLVTGLTGVVFHLFTDYRPMTVPEIVSHFENKLILWPWNVISALENAFIQHRWLLLMAAAVTLILYILIRVADEFADIGTDPIPLIISYVVPVLFTVVAGSLIVKNVLGYEDWGRILKEHPFFQAAESRADFPFYRIVSVYLLCALSSFCLMRSWYRYSSIGTSSLAGTIGLMAGVMALLLLAAAGLVLMTFDAVALLLTSVVSTLIVIAAGVILGAIFKMGGTVGELESDFIREKNRFGLGVSSQEAGRALMYMDDDDPDQPSMLHAFYNGDDEDEDEFED